MLPPAESLEVYRPPDMSGHVLGRPFSPAKLPLHAWKCIPSNTRFLGPTQVHVPNGISIGSAVFAPLMAESPYTVQWAAPPFPLKIDPLRGRYRPYLVHGSFGPPDSTSQTTS